MHAISDLPGTDPVLQYNPGWPMIWRLLVAEQGQAKTSAGIEAELNQFGGGPWGGSRPHQQ